MFVHLYSTPINKDIILYNMGSLKHACYCYSVLNNRGLTLNINVGSTSANKLLSGVWWQLGMRRSSARQHTELTIRLPVTHLLRMKSPLIPPRHPLDQPNTSLISAFGRQHQLSCRCLRRSPVGTERWTARLPEFRADDYTSSFCFRPSRRE